MKTYFLRAVAVLLLPCMLIDPTWAAGFHATTISIPTIPNPIFFFQALNPAGTHYQGEPTWKEFQRESAVRPVPKEQDLIEATNVAAKDVDELQETHPEIEGAIQRGEAIGIAQFESADLEALFAGTNEEVASRLIEGLHFPSPETRVEAMDQINFYFKWEKARPHLKDILKNTQELMRRLPPSESRQPFRLVLVLSDDPFFTDGRWLAHTGAGRKSKPSEHLSPTLYLHWTALETGLSNASGLQHLLSHEVADFSRGRHTWQSKEEQIEVEKFWGQIKNNLFKKSAPMADHMLGYMSWNTTLNRWNPGHSRALLKLLAHSNGDIRHQALWEINRRKEKFASELTSDDFMLILPFLKSSDKYVRKAADELFRTLLGLPEQLHEPARVIKVKQGVFTVQHIQKMIALLPDNDRDVEMRIQYLLSAIAYSDDLNLFNPTALSQLLITAAEMQANDSGKGENISSWLTSLAAGLIKRGIQPDSKLVRSYIHEKSTLLVSNHASTRHSAASALNELAHVYSTQLGYSQLNGDAALIFTPIAAARLLRTLFMVEKGDKKPAAEAWEGLQFVASILKHANRQEQAKITNRCLPILIEHLKSSNELFQYRAAAILKRFVEVSPEITSAQVDAIIQRLGDSPKILDSLVDALSSLSRNIAGSIQPHHVKDIFRLTESRKTTDRVAGYQALLSIALGEGGHYITPDMVDQAIKDVKRVRLGAASSYKEYGKFMLEEESIITAAARAIHAFTLGPSARQITSTHIHRLIQLLDAPDSLQSFRALEALKAIAENETLAHLFRAEDIGFVIRSLGTTKTVNEHVISLLKTLATGPAGSHFLPTHFDEMMHGLASSSLQTKLGTLQALEAIGDTPVGALLTPDHLNKMTDLFSDTSSTLPALHALQSIVQGKGAASLKNHHVTAVISLLTFPDASVNKAAAQFLNALSNGPGAPILNADHAKQLLTLYSELLKTQDGPTLKADILSVADAFGAFANLPAMMSVLRPVAPIPHLLNTVFPQGRFDIQNPVHRLAAFLTIRQEIKKTHFTREMSFEEYSGFLNAYGAGNEDEKRIEDQEKAELVYLAFEAFLLKNWLLNPLAHQAATQKRRMHVVANLSYGGVALSPIENELKSEDVTIIETKVGSTESHDNPYILNADLFNDADLINMIRDKPHLVIVDGSYSLRSDKAKDARYPDAYQGFRNFVLALELILQKDRLDPETFGVTREFCDSLELIPEFANLRTRVHHALGTGIRPSREVYDLKFWTAAKAALQIRSERKVLGGTPDRLDLANSEGPVDEQLQKITGPSLIITETAVENSQIWDPVSSLAGYSPHVESFYDDKNHFKRFHLTVDATGPHTSNLFRRMTQGFYQDLTNLLKSRETPVSSKSIAGLYDLLLLDLDGTLSETLEPISPEMADTILGLLSKGVSIALVTAQSLPEIKRNFLAPLMKQTSDPALLAHLYFAASEGSTLYRFNAEGSLQEAAPVYREGLSEPDHIRLLAAVRSLAASQNVDVLDRQTMISFHGVRDRDGFARTLQSLFRTDPAFESLEITKSGRTSMHIVPAGVSKKTASDYLRAMLSPRSVLVMGDSFGKKGRDWTMTRAGDTVVSVSNRSPKGPYVIAHLLGGAKQSSDVLKQVENGQKVGTRAYVPSTSGEREMAPASIAYWIVLAFTGDVARAVRAGRSRWTGHQAERVTFGLFGLIAALAAPMLWWVPVLFHVLHVFVMLAIASGKTRAPPEAGRQALSFRSVAAQFSVLAPYGLPAFLTKSLNLPLELSLPVIGLTLASAGFLWLVTQRHARHDERLFAVKQSNRRNAEGQPLSIEVVAPGIDTNQLREELKLAASEAALKVLEAGFPRVTRESIDASNQQIQQLLDENVSELAVDPRTGEIRKLHLQDADGNSQRLGMVEAILFERIRAPASTSLWLDERFVPIVGGEIYRKNGVPLTEDELVKAGLRRVRGKDGHPVRVRLLSAGSNRAFSFPGPWVEPYVTEGNGIRVLRNLEEVRAAGGLGEGEVTRETLPAVLRELASQGKISLRLKATLEYVGIGAAKLKLKGQFSKALHQLDGKPVYIPAADVRWLYGLGANASTYGGTGAVDPDKAASVTNDPQLRKEGAELLADTVESYLLLDVDGFPEIGTIEAKSAWVSVRLNNGTTRLEHSISMLSNVMALFTANNALRVRTYYAQLYGITEGPQLRSLVLSHSLKNIALNIRAFWDAGLRRDRPGDIPGNYGPLFEQIDTGNDELRSFDRQHPNDFFEELEEMTFEFLRLQLDTFSEIRLNSDRAFQALVREPGFRENFLVPLLRDPALAERAYKAFDEISRAPDRQVPKPKLLSDDIDEMMTLPALDKRRFVELVQEFLSQVTFPNQQPGGGQIKVLPGVKILSRSS